MSCLKLEDVAIEHFGHFELVPDSKNLEVRFLTLYHNTFVVYKIDWQNIFDYEILAS